jgi:hypothetical protein
MSRFKTDVIFEINIPSGTTVYNQFRTYFLDFIRLKCVLIVAFSVLMDLYAWWLEIPIECLCLGHFGFEIKT